MIYTNKKIWHITLPILISLFMEHMISLTDTAFLGRVGEIELAASALAGVYYLSIFMLFFGFSIGAQILIGHKNGEGKPKDIGPIFMQGTIFLIALAFFMFFVSQRLSPSILVSMIKSEPIFHATNSYLKWRVYGFFFTSIAVMFRAFYVGTTNTKILTINSIVMVLTNVLLNYLLIFGKFGFPKLGIAGAAIGSSLSEMVSVIFFIIYTYRKVDWKKYHMFRFNGFKPKILKNILNTSIWTMIQSFLAVSTWFMFFLAVEHLGEKQLAISNIVRSASTLFFIPVSAFAATTSSLVSNLLGSKHPEQVLPTCFKTIKLCYCFTIPVLIILFVIPSLVLNIFTDNVDLIKSTIPSLYVMASSVLFSTPGSILFNAVSGTGKTRKALIMEFCTLVIYVGYMIYIVMYLKLDVAICWTTEHAYWLFMLLFSFIYMRKVFGKYKSTRETFV